jgi:hypothetical protein
MPKAIAGHLPETEGHFAHRAVEGGRRAVRHRDACPVEAAMRKWIAGSVLSLAWAAGLPAAAQTLNVMAYWVNQIPNTCTATNPAVGGTFHRQFPDDADQCPGLQIYHVTKGHPFPWGSGSGYVAGGYFRLMNEITMAAGGAMAAFRVFRDVSTGAKGVIDFQTVIPTQGAAWVHAPSVEEHWVDDAGQPSCAATRHSRVDPGSSLWGRAWPSGTWTAWLQDQRAASTDRAAWHDVRTVTVAQFWGGSDLFPLGRFEERYTYGRWRSPVNGLWHGVGLMRWECIDHGSGASCGLGEYRYLVDCLTRMSCSTCPP